MTETAERIRTLPVPDRSPEKAAAPNFAFHQKVMTTLKKKMEAALAQALLDTDGRLYRHPLIEPAHLLIGVLSLGKLDTGPDGSGGPNAARVRDEHGRLLHALASCSLDPIRLRRRARSQVGRGSAVGPPAGPSRGRSPARPSSRRRRPWPGRTGPSASPISSPPSPRTWTW
jgi:hypothetical protein